MKYKLYWVSKLRLIVAALVVAGLGYVSTLADSDTVSAAAGPYTLRIEPLTGQPGQHLDLANIISRQIGNPENVDCGLGGFKCSVSFLTGTAFTLDGSVLGGNSDIEFRWHPVDYGQNTSLTPLSDDFCTPRNTGAANGATCTATMPDTDVTIYFTASYTKSLLQVGKSGTGSGTIASHNPPTPSSQINCGSKCAADISSMITLHAISDAGSSFAGWRINGGPAPSCNPGNVSNPCRVAVDVGPRGDGQTDTYTAVFDKDEQSNEQPAQSNGNKPASKQKQNRGQVLGTRTAKPEAPKAAVQVAGKQVDPAQKIVLQSNQSLHLSGTTIPNGKVTLYLFSEPQTFTTVADGEGKWEYAINNIPPGDHHVEAEVTDPKTDQTSERAYLVAVSVDKINNIDPEYDSEEVMEESGIMAIVIGAAATIAAVGAMVAIYLAVRHRNKIRRVHSRVVRLPKSLRRRQ